MFHDNDDDPGTRRPAGVRWYLGVLALIALAVAVSLFLQPDASDSGPAASTAASR